MRRIGTTRQESLGVDIGRVISAEDTDAGVSILSNDWERTPFVPGCLAVLRALNLGGPFAGRVHLVSKCGPLVEDRTRKWLALTGFFDVTGISPTAVTYVRERRDKARICAELGITHFVDDRLGVLDQMPFVPFRYLFAPSDPPQVPPKIRRVRSWQDLEVRLRADRLDA